MATSARQILQRVRANLAEAGRARYTTGTTSSDGNAGGTTFIASGLNIFLDDHFNGAYARLLSGTGAWHKRPRITDFTQSTGTVTATEGFGAQVVAGVSFEIFDEEIYSDVDLFNWINAEQDELVDVLTNDALLLLLKRGNTGAVAGFGGGITAFAALPSDAVRIISADISGRVVAILNPKERTRFYDDPFIPGTANEPVGIYSQDGTTPGIELRPNNNATVKWTYIPRITEVSLSQDDVSMPDHYVDLLVLGATARALRSSEDYTQAREFETKKFTRIKAINEQNQGTPRLEA